MRHTFTIILTLIALCAQAQTVYVKWNASGSNNGSSWANAYTSLDAALLAAAPGQSIWVAAGTYKPSTPAPDNSFPLQSGVSMYGGFAGTETALNQRNIAANPTILSGDISGNDITGNFTTNRTDNSPHVVVMVSVSSADRAVLDGFTIKGGQTLVGDPNADLTRRGAGVLVNTKATVRNCIFNDNYGESGAGLAVIGNAGAGVLVDNCLFEGNKVTEQAILLLRQTPNGEVNKCVFRNNQTNRGALYPVQTGLITIDSCLFERNDGGSNFGAAMFSWQAGWNMSNCIFRGNKSANAAGIYIDNRDGGDVVNINNCLFEKDTTTSFGGGGIYGWQATVHLKNTIFRENYGPDAAASYFNGSEFDSEYSLDSCLFERNVTTDYGGSSIWNNRTKYTLSNCIFRENKAPSSGAALYNGDSTVFVVKNCLFDGNTGNYAAAIANYGIGCNGTFESCTFSNNMASQGGGAVSNGFKADVLFKSCAFNTNSAKFGGAIFTQNDTTRLRVENSVFNENGTTGNGGAIYVNPHIATSIKNCEFTYNTGDYGAAIQAIGDSLLWIENTIFRDNYANTQGGALNLNEAKAVLTNCLFARNINLGAGAGGAISINASDSVQSRVKIVNSTFADNEAAIGAGIAQWEAAAGDAQLSLLNCLFQNSNGDNYAIEQGEPEVFSLNGNQSSDASLTNYLSGAKDVNNLAQVFADPSNDNYQLTPSPAVNGGEAAGAPLKDLLGHTRTGLPDRGCYEYGTSGTSAPGFSVMPLQCSPNPAVDYTSLSLENEQKGAVEITLWDQSGRRLSTFNTEKTEAGFQFRLDLKNLPAGIYRVQCRFGTAVHEGKFVKS